MMEETNPPSPTPRRRFWQRWIIDPVRKQLTQGVSPGRIAASIAVGSALALFPILGTTTTLCILAGIFLRLNQPILQAVNALCFPIYLPLLVVFVHLGEHLVGAGTTSLNIPLMITVASNHPMEFLHQFGATALHAILGWAVVAPVWVAVVFLALRPVLRASARRIASGA